MLEIQNHLLGSEGMTVILISPRLENKETQTMQRHAEVVAEVVGCRRRGKRNPKDMTAI
jgi:hypothetical protein